MYSDLTGPKTLTQFTNIIKYNINIKTRVPVGDGDCFKELIHPLTPRKLAYQSRNSYNVCLQNTARFFSSTLQLFSKFLSLSDFFFKSCSVKQRDH